MYRAGYTANLVSNAARMLMREPRNGTRSISVTLVQKVKEEKAVYQVQAVKPKAARPQIRFTLRNATEEDIPALIQIRRDMGIHDVTTCFQSWMKIDPEGIKVATSETGEIMASCSNVKNGDDNEGVYFGGIYCVEPKFQGTGIGFKIYKACLDHAGTTNCGLNAVPGMLEVYRGKGGFPVLEEDWTCVKNQTTSHVPENVLSSKAPPGVDIQLFQDSFLPAMVDYDRALIGFKRALSLELNCKETGSRTFVAFKDGVCVGFGTIKLSCLGAGRVGPLYANDPTVAEVLLRRLLDSSPERSGFAMMTISSNFHANDFLRKLGCPVQEACNRLYTKKRMVVDVNKVYAHFDINFSLF